MRGPIPLSGWRGEDPSAPMHPPTPAELARRCPFCGEIPRRDAAELCPAFDELLARAAGGAA